MPEKSPETNGSDIVESVFPLERSITDAEWASFCLKKAKHPELVPDAENNQASMSKFGDLYGSDLASAE